MCQFFPAVTPSVFPIFQVGDTSQHQGEGEGVNQAFMVKLFQDSDNTKKKRKARPRRKRGNRRWRSYFNCCVNRWYRHVRFPVQKEVWWSFLVTLLTFYLANKSSPLSVNSFKTVGKAPGSDLTKLVEAKPRICKAAIRRTVLMSLVMFKKTTTKKAQKGQ